MMYRMRRKCFVLRIIFMVGGCILFMRMNNRIHRSYPLYVSGIPRFLIDSAIPKCIDIEAARNTILNILYEAPGMCRV